MTGRPLLTAENLVKHYKARDGDGLARAVDGVSLMLRKGETLGIVGESGCGKSTLARLVLRLIEPTSGRVLLDGEDILALKPGALRRRRRDMQIVFQDPFASLDPRMSVGRIIAEPLDIHNVGSPQERQRKVEDLLLMVGLDRSALDRYPHEFSGGQRQRIGIARAIALEPKLLVLDEPVSALDVSIQSQILNLLIDLKSRLDLSYIFISHDLSVVEHVSDRVLVMYLGRIVEEGTATQVLRQPRHPYTEALVSAVPGAKKGPRIVLKGDPPSPEAVPAGCRFHPRCPKVMDICRHTPPPSIAQGGSARAECHLYGPRPG
ncbi:ABC transporter ATP-binding protein [Aestuariivirga sp. YIM B02566]|uniref:ATP-binding cassette domain-containing protein n=1 Tax=Taklimakanibacter albus TaxID=2800327 RepID=A0ACC5REV9_9HYPH|nr:oligopeptide/dipeptide ABC transporter ATP-binding protein [Aestuariivirga sp. YIM B02566]MBK1871152.1 ATP-binding cassette domain-containing protein [Aestuariivirga sp. YIM B02566]